jgi:hypothetical protein
VDAANRLGYTFKGIKNHKITIDIQGNEKEMDFL